MNRKDAFDYKSYYLPDDIPKDILRPDSMFRQGILLHAAARSGSLAVIKLLVGLISVADVRTLNKDGASPLYVAVRYTGLEANLWEREAVVKLLMWRGPSRVHMKDKNGWTLFHSLAAGKITLNTEGPMVRMAEHLFALRVDINVRDNIGRTAMNIAEQLENNCLPPRLRFFGTLWEAMTDREPQNPWGVTPWQQSIAIAIRGKGQPKIFER
jgi:ankyrin repeat protein